MANGEWGVYRGVVNLNNANDIQHWKYIRKYRVGDKWRYVYADDETHKTINNAHSNYLTTKENSNRYGEAANIYEKYWKYTDVFKNDYNPVAERYKKSYYDAANKAASNKQASSRWYNAYMKNVENNSVSKLLNDSAKSWKKKANKVFDRLKIEANSLARLHKQSVEKRNERKRYGVTIKDELKNQIDYATDPYKWFDGPYKSLLTQRKEAEAAARKKAAEEAMKKKRPIAYLFNRNRIGPNGHGGSSRSF